jgi:uncharacterized RmlC-like cupin family protein
MSTLYRITPEERVEGQPTPGMARQQAIQTDGIWAGHVTTEAGMASGWHHHGEYESAIYVIDGAIRMEFGPGGEEAFDAGPGDFVYVPKHAVHRESDPASAPARIVVVRAGHGDPVFNVDGPE